MEPPASYDLAMADPIDMPHEPDPMTQLAALELVMRAAGAASCEAGCQPVLDELEAMTPERRRAVLHELLTLVVGANATIGMLTGEGLESVLLGIELSIREMIVS